MSTVRVRTRTGVAGRRRHQVRPTGCSSAASSSTASGKAFKTISPATEEVLAEVAEAERRRRRPRGRGRAHGIRAGLVPDVRRRPRQVPLPDRPHPAGAGPRARRPRDARQRQADQGVAATSTCPLAAAHFFYHAGWADKLDYAGLGPQPAAARRRRPGHPVELPAAHAGVEDRAGAGLRQHRRPQAGRDHAADGAALRRDLPAGRPAARASSTSSPAPARPGSALVEHPDVDKVAFTGSTERRQGDRARHRRHPQAGHPRARRQGGEHRLRRRPDRPGRRGHRQRHLLQPGPRLLRRLAAARAGERRTTRSSRKLKRRLATLRVGDPLDKNTDVGAINSKPPARADPRARRRPARPRARALVSRRASCPRSGFWFAPTFFTGVAQAHRIAPRGDLRAGAVGADLPHPARGGREGQQHAVRAVRRHLDREGLADPLDGRPAARRRGLGQHVQQVRPDVAVRRLQGVRLRPRGRPARARGLRRDGRQLHEPDRHAASATRRRRPQDLQALHRRRLPALRVRPLVRGHATPAGRGVPRQRRAGLAQGRPRRGRRRPRRVRRVGRRHGVQPRAGALPRRRGDGGPPRPVRRRGRGRRGADPARARRARRRRDRPLGLVRRLDRQARPGARRAQPGRRARTSTSRAPEPTGVVAVLAPQRRRCSAWCRVVAPAVCAGNTVVVVASEERPLPAVTLAEVLATTDVPGGVVNLVTGAHRRAGPWLASHRDVNAIDLAGAAGAAGVAGPTSSARPPRTSSGSSGPRAPAPTRSSRTGASSRVSPGSAPFLETKTVWHPKGR